MAESHGTSFPDVLSALTEEFTRTNAAHISTYKEDWARADYIEPFFEALGWKRLNPALLTTGSTGFIREVALHGETSARAPDYGFYVNGKREFYVEAKKPYINIKVDVRPAYQIRDYGWSASDDIGIVTDFEELALYNCRVRPDHADGPEVGLIDYMRFEEYRNRWEWLVATLTPTAVADGSLTALVQGYRDKKRLVPVGLAFLTEIESWRETLAKAIAKENPLAAKALSGVVQTLLDRIIFLRIAAARGFEHPQALRSVLAHTPIYPALFALFEAADIRYNSGLFHFRKEAGREAPDAISGTLVIDDRVLRSIIERLTGTESPYRFEVISADILGQIYERFLGSEIVVKDGDVSVEKKPQYRKSGGVYYTPTFVVEYIVDRTLGPLLAGKSVNQARTLRIVDPACGSGSFLISAYQYLIDWHTERYSQYKRRADRDRFLMRGVDGRLRLRTGERKRILLNNIFGVDIDHQAVEVTKLSLLLKVIEGETQMAMQIERLLPDLVANVVCGNSLVGTDFYSTKELIQLTPDEAERVNAFDWTSAFPELTEFGGFDAVIGNPPWLMAGYYVEDSMPYFHRHYQSEGKVDLYYLFLEKAMRLVQPDGRIGMIVPSKLFHTQAAKRLRALLADDSWIEEIVDFGTRRIFEGATNYSCILTMSRNNSGPIRVRIPDRLVEGGKDFSISRSDLGASTWHLIEPDRRELWKRLSGEFAPLRSLASAFGNGVQSGADSVLIMSDDARRRSGIEDAICRPILRGRDIRQWVADATSVLVFPYSVVAGEHRIMSESRLQSEFPGAYIYLKDHEAKLRGRVWFKKSPVELSGEWYGMMYLDDFDAFVGRKIVTPALASESNFAEDDGSLFVTGTAGVSSVRLTDHSDTLRYFVLGILNSSLLSNFIVDHSTPYQGGYYKFSAPYIREAPIAMPDLSLRSGKRQLEEIAGIAEALSAPREGRNASIEPLVRRLDELVLALYRLSEDERASLM